MLTVSKLTGTAGAILAYAEGRSEKLRGDYYLSAQGAAPERAQVAWSPELHGNAQAGLAGDVDPEARGSFERVMAGQDPGTGEQVITSPLRRRRNLADSATRGAAYAHAEELGLSPRRRRPLTRDQAQALQGATAAEEARAILRAARRDAERGTGASPAGRVSGIDLTFSAPKSVSVLWGLTRDPELREGLERAHTLAGRRALRELQSRGLVGRARVDGKRVRVPLQWVGIEAVHTTARLSEQGAREGRPPDPDLHTHTVVANMGWDPATHKWRAVDAGVLLHVRSLGDGVYLTELATQLHGLGLEVVPNTGRDGRYLEVQGILTAWCEAFSQRAHEVRRARELLGIETDVPARALAPATRRGKSEEEQAGDHTEAWRAHLAERFGDEALESVDQLARAMEGGRQHDGIPVERPLAEREGELLARFFGPEGLTAHEASHTQVAVEATLWHLNGGRLTSEEMAALVPRVLQEPRLQVLDDGRYTTRELLHQEVAVERAGRALLDTGPSQEAGVVVDPVQIVAAALARVERESGVTLSDEQQRAVRLLTDPARRLTLMGGPAGAGKTTTLRAAREVWTGEGGQGREVVVLSVAASTAQRSAREIGGSRGMTFEEFSLRRRSGQLGDAQTEDLVVVVDEAAMADTPRLHSLLSQVGGASLVLLGDERQLQAVGAGGGWLRLKGQAKAAGGYCELTQVHRQRYEWERRALDELRQGRGGDAVARYLVHGRIRITETRPEARRQVAEAWNGARLAGESQGRPISEYVMVAATREDTQVLNQWAQGMRRQRDELGEGITLQDPAGGREVFQGDRVRLDGRLDREHPNGLRGTATAVTEAGLWIAWDGAEHPHSLYRPQEHESTGQLLQLDYAGTAQRSQGVTAEQAFVLPAPQQHLEGLYSALSRAREETTVWLDAATWGDRLSELQPQEREVVEQAELVARLAESVATAKPKWGALDAGVDSGRAAREEAAREKVAAYLRVVETQVATVPAEVTEPPPLQRPPREEEAQRPPSRKAEERPRESEPSPYIRPEGRRGYDAEEELRRQREMEQAMEWGETERERGPSVSL